MEHLSTDFGNLGLSRGGSGGGGGASSGSGQWPRAQAPPSRNSPPQGQRSGYHHQSSSAGSRESSSQQQQQRSGEDWKQLESDLNAATAKEFVPGNAWSNQHSSNSSVGSNSQGRFFFCKRE